MKFNNISFILVRPQLGENIGACARALKNFQFKNLKIVSPKCSWPNDKAKSTSVAAKNIINSVKVYNSIEKATINDNLIIATTSRIRNKNKKFINFKKLFSKIRKYRKICFLFGPESSGLNNKEISYANCVIKIPTNPKFESINLSHSLMLICHEIYKEFSKKKIKFESSYSGKLATKSSINIFIKRLIKNLDEIGFLQPTHKRNSMIININNIFHRFEISQQELHILQGIFANLKNRNYKKVN